MAKAKDNLAQIAEKIEKKIKRREIKKNPKMRVSGKRVFQLKNIIKK
jgi:hypothetical protein